MHHTAPAASITYARAHDVNTLAGLEGLAAAAENGTLDGPSRHMLSSGGWGWCVPEGADAPFARLIAALSASNDLVSADRLLAEVDVAAISASVRAELVMQLLLLSPPSRALLDIRAIDELSPAQLDGLWANKGGDDAWESIRAGAVLALAIYGDPRIAPWASAHERDMADAEPPRPAFDDPLRVQAAREQNAKWLRWHLTRDALRLADRLPRIVSDPWRSAPLIIADAEPGVDLPHNAEPVLRLLVRRGLPIDVTRRLVRERLTGLLDGAIVIREPFGDKPSPGRIDAQAIALRTLGLRLGVIAFNEFPRAADPADAQGLLSHDYTTGYHGPCARAGLERARVHLRVLGATDEFLRRYGEHMSRLGDR